jgi:hypothetical protein
MRELQLEMSKQQRRIADLTRRRSEGGHGLDEDAPVVLVEPNSP